MTEPLENLYFNWLCAKVIRVENPTPSLTYWKLFRQLHNTEFVWLVSGDDNRAEDGLELRTEFLYEAHLNDDAAWHGVGCSIFEMLIAFARRTKFMAGETVQFWFWLFLENLGLNGCNDASRTPSSYIEEILDNFVWRNYRSSGQGGLFPMSNPPADQRKVEIWYQFCEYLVDRDWPL
jgi:hypothetical protein